MSGNYSNNIFDYILDQINIVDVIESYIPISRAGKNHKALCPFHNEKTASFIISEDKQLFHCFGCGVAGNAINFVMQYDNLDYIDAVEKLADQYHIDISQFRSGKDKKNTSHLSRYYDILRTAAIYFYKNLRHDEAALKYLRNRGIDYDIIKKFGLGFSNDAWSDLLKALSSKYSLADLEAVGLLIKGKNEGKYYDRFRNRVMFPIINPKGKIIGFGGRVMDDSLPKYLNSPETDVFNKSATLYGLNIAKDHLADKKTLIIAEGYMDVIALHVYGFNNAVATLGTALTKDHGRLMRRYADEVIICYDSDFAGQKATLRSLDVLEGIVEKVRVVVLGENLDPDEYLKKYGEERFKEKLDQAISGTEYKINHLKNAYNLNEEQQKIEFLSKAVLIIRELNNAFEKNLFIEKLSKELNVNPEMVAKEAYQDQYDNKQRYGFTGKEKKTLEKPLEKKPRLEEQLLAFYIFHHEQINENQIKMLEHFNFTQTNQPVFDYLVHYFKENDVFDQQVMIENADLDVSRHLLEIIEQNIDDLDDIHIENVLNLIQLSDLDEKIDQLNKQLKMSASDAVRADWQKLIIERNRLKSQTQLRRNTH